MDYSYTLLETKRGGIAVAYNNCKYSYNKRNSSGVVYYKCIESACGHYVHLKDNKMIYASTNKHTHLDNHIEEINRMKVLMICKEKIKENPLANVRKSFQDTVSATVPPSQLSKAPTFKSCDAGLYNYRHNFIPPNPASIDDLIIAEDFKKSITNQQFLQIQSSRESQKILIFFTDEFIEELCKSDTLIMDGTFKSTPALFYQLYVIHFRIGQTKCTMPGVYALLPNKTESTYGELLDLLIASCKSKGFEFKPATVIVDFELAMINAIRSRFDEATTKIRLCLFHFDQSLFRAIQRFNLVSAYTKEGRVRDQLRKCMALPLLESDQVFGAFQKIVNQLVEEKLDSPEVLKFIFYLSNTYVNDGATFHRALWSGLNGDFRTINNAEGWNHSTNQQLSKPHVSVHRLIKHLQDDNYKYQLELAEYRKSGSVRARKNKYILIDKRISELKEQLSKNEIDSDRFLHVVAHCLKSFTVIDDEII